VPEPPTPRQSVMTEKGWDKDEWPALYERVQAADILILGSPIWLGEKSSVCIQVIERLYAMSAEVNERGQYAYYGKVGGCVITGNEDGVEHCAMGILYALQHIGYTIPPQPGGASPSQRRGLEPSSDQGSRKTWHHLSGLWLRCPGARRPGQEPESTAVPRS